MAATLVRRVMLQITADDADAEAKIDAIKAKADELRELHPELTPRLDTAEAQAKMAVLRDELKQTAAAADETPLDIRVSSAEAQAKLDAIKANAEELRAMNPTLVPRIDDMEASAQLAVLRGELGETEAASAGLAKGWEVTKYALLGVGGALAYGTYKAAGFQSQMERVHTQAGVAQSQLKSLGSGVLALAGQVGENPDSLAESLYHVASNMASLGASGPKMLSAVKVAAEGARVGGADLVDVTNALGAVIASNIPGVQNYQAAMGALNATVGAGDMTMQNLAEAMGTGFLSNVKIYGTTLNDVGAILATFGDNNIRGAHAGTQLRMSVQAIAVTASTAAPYLKELGLQIGELGQYQSLHGTVATVNLLVDRLKASGVATSDWGNIITQIFGKKAGAGIAVLIDQDERLNSKQKVLAEGAKDFGAAWKAQQGTAGQQLADLESGAEALATSLGQDLLPVAIKVIGWTADFVNGLEKGSAGATTVAGIIGVVLAGIALKKLEDGLKGAVEGFEQLYQGGKKAIGWTVQLASKLGLVKTAQEAETAATEEGTVATEASSAAFAVTPIGWIVLGIGAIAIAIVELTKHSKAFRDFWKDAWHDIAHGFDELRHGAAELGHDIATWFDRIRHDIAQWADDARHDTDLVITWFKSLPGRILHTLEGLPGDLLHLGEHIIQGLINGIEEKASELLGDVEHLGSSLLSGLGAVLGISSPSKEFYKIGAMITAGLASGISGTSSGAVEEAARLARLVAYAAAEGLITGSEATSLKNKIASALASAMKSGTLAGLTGTSSQIASSEKTLLAAVAAGISGGTISGAQGSALAQYIKNDTDKLKALATERAKIAATIKAADAYSASIVSSTESTFGIVSAAQSITPALGVGGILRQLLGDVSQIRTFRANIAKLRRMGLNRAYIAQLIQAGPVTGGQIAAELAAGSEADIKQVNAAEAQIASASTSLGQTAADAMYDTGKMAGKGFLSGLEAQQKAIEKLMEQIADAMIAQLRKKLGIHSPSAVMREHGRMTVEGFALGIMDGMPLVTQAMAHMTHATVPAYAAAGGGSRNGVLQLEWVGGQADSQFMTWLKRNIRIRGGDPSVLGA